MADSGDNVEAHVDAFDNEVEQSSNNEAQRVKSRGIHNEEEAYLDPSRWWFASSAFPMIAGTLGPVASAFSICALVRPWRQHFPPGSDIDKAEFIDDPIWLIVINAIQLSTALIANLILLLNMAKKIKFTIAQPITIVTWYACLGPFSPIRASLAVILINMPRYISAILLMALAATASGPLIQEPQNEYIWSQAFYYGIYAAVLYFFCSSLMVVTFWGALKGHYSKDFQLTTSQRTLMLQTIMFLVYLLVGALVFSSIEDWPYLDGVYWADVTLFTVGFGDFSAATPLGRALLFPYALVGVISLGLVVGSIRSLVLERARQQLGARIFEKKRKQILRKMVRKGKDDILVPVVEDEGDYDEGANPSGLTELARRQKEFELMRKIQAKSERRRRWMAMGISTTVWLMLWLVGAAIFQQCEVTYQGWTYFDGFYFAFVSLTTIGYGDVTPISPAGKSFFVFWSLLALPTMTVLISNAGDTVVKMIREWTDWLGTVTILPSDRGFKKEAKAVLRALSMGTLFTDDSDIEESPPGFLGNAEEHRHDSELEEEKQMGEEGNRARERSTEKLEKEIEQVMGEEDRKARIHTTAQTRFSSSRTQSSTTSRTRPVTPTSNTRISFQDPLRASDRSHKTASLSNLERAASKDNSASGSPRSATAGAQQPGLKTKRTMSMPRTTAELPRSVPDNQHDYAVVLIDEIGRVTQHLKSKPPRKYTFEEWAWFLILIGEDEGRADTHKKPVAKSRKRKKANGAGDGTDAEDFQWSWVGTRSPLMSSQEEAEWILEKLEQRLAEELRAMRDEALGDGS